MIEKTLIKFIPGCGGDFVANLLNGNFPLEHDENNRYRYPPIEYPITALTMPDNPYPWDKDKHAEDIKDMTCWDEPTLTTHYLNNPLIARLYKAGVRNVINIYDTSEEVRLLFWHKVFGDRSFEESNRVFNKIIDAVKAHEVNIAGYMNRAFHVENHTYKSVLNRLSERWSTEVYEYKTLNDRIVSERRALLSPDY